MFETNTHVPHLTTALTGPLQFLEKHFLKHQVEIECWLRSQWQKTLPPFYCSVDLRNAGFKLAPIDTNLFPAGFNNLNPDFMPLCIQAVQSTIERICPDIEEVLLIPESHTRNLFYLENLATLYEILTKAGLRVRLGSLIPDLVTPRTINLPSGRAIILEPLQRQEQKIGVENFFPSFILLNNDFSDGVPPILQNLHQKIMPPLQLGWSNRLKSGHFQHYQNVAHEFCNRFDIDSWLLTPLFRYCGEIDFMTREGEDCLVRNAETILKAIQSKYQEYKISHAPFIVIKADAGTYGMAVMTVDDPQKLRQLNRKQRTQMAASKGGKAVRKVIIQEGVHTFETWGEQKASAEPVVYMIGQHVVGGFYRVHHQRGAAENLNAPGMNFEPLAFAGSCNNPCYTPDNCTNRFYAYGVVGRLALLAAARELKEVGEQPCR